MKRVRAKGFKKCSLAGILVGGYVIAEVRMGEESVRVFTDRGRKRLENDGVCFNSASPITINNFKNLRYCNQIK